MVELQKRFLNTINTYNMIKSGDKVIVGVSGGPDSVCLLHLLITFKKQLGIDVYVAHLDHMFRALESKEDTDFVKDLCKRWDVPFFSDRVNVPKFVKESGMSPEDAARRIRYRFFSRVREKIGADKIATGHNQNDHEETILMNIFRGTGLDGLQGIEPVRDYYIRPLIEVPRDAIEEYLKKEGIPTRIDSTNLTTEYFRNSLRLELIPLISQKYCPHLGESLRRLSQISRREISFLKEETKKAWAKSAKSEAFKVTIDVKKFSQLHEAVKYRLARAAVEKLVGNVKDFEAIHTQLLVDFIEKASAGSKIDLPKKLQGVKEYDCFILTKGNLGETPDYCYTLKVPGEITIKETGISVKAYIQPRSEQDIVNTDPATAYFDYNKIGSDLVIRNRRSGDRFKPLGGTGFKKLKDFFIDEKVPRRKRNEIPVIESDGQIIWVGGMRIDDRYKVTKETKEVLILEIMKFDNGK